MCANPPKVFDTLNITNGLRIQCGKLLNTRRKVIENENSLREKKDCLATENKNAGEECSWRACFGSEDD
jgi:hypothetical protein